MCVYVCMHVCRYYHEFVCVVGTKNLVCVCVCCTHVCACVYMHVCVCVCVCVRTVMNSDNLRGRHKKLLCICICAHIYTHTHTYTHTYCKTMYICYIHTYHISYLCRAMNMCSMCVCEFAVPRHLCMHVL
jgi:hypothetical protein